MKLYAKINGVVRARDVAADQVAAYLRRGWTKEPPKAAKPAVKSKKSS